tara:strand:+ start:315 stop:638 length:324 start_codon:yes stop_codon:yes gene_type:complete
MSLSTESSDSNNKSKYLLEKYPERKPIILRNEDNKTYKFLAHNNHTISVILIPLRKKMDIRSHESIFLFINKQIIPCSTDQIIDLYNKYKSKDGFLYIDVRKENTFG